MTWCDVTQPYKTLPCEAIDIMIKCSTKDTKTEYYSILRMTWRPCFCASFSEYPEQRWTTEQDIILSIILRSDILFSVHIKKAYPHLSPHYQALLSPCLGLRMRCLSYVLLLLCPIILERLDPSPWSWLDDLVCLQAICSRRGAKSEKGEARFYQKSQADWPRCCPGALWWSSGDNLAVMGDSLLWSSSLRSWDDGMSSARSQLSLRKHNNQSSSQLTVFIQDLLRAGRQHSPEILCAVCDSLIVNLPSCSSDYLRQSCKQNHPVRYILSPLSHTPSQKAWQLLISPLIQQVIFISWTR